MIRYEADWDVKSEEGYKKLALTMVGETAQLWVNGEYCGSVVAKPYWFDLDEVVRPGKNHLCIEVMNNLAYREGERHSTYIPLPPTGLVGKVLVK